ncbi:MAG: bifunctional pyr operon transcriptional regulator/uracil phosphoribosyltransferase PyrR [Bacteroidetes bacterium]|nr:bifunctional pyr operon transcriptional regulator/uracil phosphoribosyltransferase PyrR [Bacteroidota bacterium]
MTTEHFRLTLERLTYELIERHDRFADACLVGIQPRGSLLADRIYARLKELNAFDQLPYGKLDITFYRDDFRIREKPLRANAMNMDFLVEGKEVILVDDVLYTGRTVQAALTALQHYGRPRRVELLALIDRRFNRHLPIKADYSGLRIDALDEAYVKVQWADGKVDDSVLLYPTKEDSKEN